MILFPVLSSWMGMDGRRRLVQVFPNPIREWWDKWEIRGLVLISIVSQIILTILGNRRKYGTNKVTDSVLWGTYVLADKVPSIALGVISSKLGDYYDRNGEKMGDPQLMAFWAPFFLMHIGGPDTITAYSLEDNELWLRHLVGLVFQTLLALYIILLSWDSSSWLSYLSIPMLIIGCDKYGERTWCLFSASSNYDLDSQLGSYFSKSEKLRTAGLREMRSILKGFVVSSSSDMVLTTKDIQQLRKKALSADIASIFRSIDDYHGLTYDFFYTKISIICNGWLVITKLVTFLALVVVLTLYITFTTESLKYLGVDYIITLLLLLEAIITHFVSSMLIVPIDLLLSRNMKHIEGGFIEWWLSKNVEPMKGTLLRIGNWFNKQILEKRKRWYLIAQCNFFTLLFSEKDKFCIFGDSLPIRNVKKIHIISRCPASSNLKEILVKNIKMKSTKSASTQSQHGPRYKELVKAQRLCRQNLIIENLKFHQSILLWHIVTSVCYYHCNDSIHSRESKVLSDYMFYLLVKQRHMLPIGVGLASLRDTLVEAIKFCEVMKGLTLPSNMNEACKTILQHIGEDTEYVANHPKGRSVFCYAFIIANDLLTRGDEKQMWDFLMELWIEIINYSATQCRTDKHAQQLANGGEFVTQIWMLQFTFGLMEQF